MMVEHNDIRQLISLYCDGEASPQEKQQVEDHIKTCQDCKKYHQDMLKLSSSLHCWTDEDLSPDLEQKIKKNLSDVKPREGKEMKIKSPLIPAGVLVAVIVAGVVGLQTYAQRGLQGCLKDVSDDIGSQYSPGNPSAPMMQITKSKTPGATTQYEPYYLKRDYSVGKDKEEITFRGARQEWGQQARMLASTPMPTEEGKYYPHSVDFNTEQYDRIYENEFLTVTENPLSTFSIDVDTASYSNLRRFLNNNQLPPKDAVRIEEMINYFTYDYPKPEGDVPFSITTKASICPWNKDHSLVMVGLQGKTLQAKEIPASNLVFLIDVSGSMDQPNKLPLLKSAFKLLVNQLREEERVAIVVYAGAAGLVLESTPGSDKQKILQAIDNLQAGGSTAGGAGIKLAYKIAKENLIKGGNNRVILATDGDFNTGVSSTAEMVRLIEEKRKDGIFLTILGFGTGNYKDSRMEQIADKGNGNYYYIDTYNEAKKVLVTELGSTLFAIAKDVKIQVEFNPSQVKAYRLIGYENRILAKEDFNDDTKDAGELGAGHSVTALYELVPADSKENFGNVDELTYQQSKIVTSSDLMTVKLRYKDPDADKSKLLKETITAGEVTVEPKDDFQFTAAVAEFGLLLRDSKFKGTASYEHVIQSAKGAKGKDTYGYRTELIDLVMKTQTLDTSSGIPGIFFKGEESK